MDWVFRSVCQEAVKTCRETAASLGLWFRPRLFQAAAPDEADEARPAVPGSESSGSPGIDYHDYETLYLSCSAAKKGVLQLHGGGGGEGGWVFEGLSCLWEPTWNALCTG